jgi:hypothetical protein
MSVSPFSLFLFFLFLSSSCLSLPPETTHLGRQHRVKLRLHDGGANAVVHRLHLEGAKNDEAGLGIEIPNQYEPEFNST